MVYFSDRISLDVQAQSVDLGDPDTGVRPFINQGFFRDAAIVIRLTFNPTTSRYTASAAFVEGPEKTSSTSQPELLPLSATDIPVARFVIRHNGNTNSLRGQIEPITQDAIEDFRDYIDVGGVTYYSATVGDRQVQFDGYGTLTTDAYGVAVINGETIGAFTGTDEDGIHPLQQAIDSLSTTGGTVFVRRGTYTINSTLTIPDNVELVGEGRTSVIQMGSSLSGAMIIINGDNVKLENLTIKGPLPDSSSNTSIQLSNATRAIIKNCYIEDSIVGLDFIGSTRNIIANNFFIDNSVGVRLTGTTNNLLNSNQFEGSTTDDIQGSTNNQTVGNILSGGV
mgnify:CR=1 FL=1